MSTQNINSDETLFGFPIDKNLEDFNEIAKNLFNENQTSRANAILYLIARCQKAEKTNVEMNESYKTLYESATKLCNGVDSFAKEFEESKKNPIKKKFTHIWAGRFERI